MAEQPWVRDWPRDDFWDKAKQPWPHDVIVYCDQCASRHGSRRLLAAADRDATSGQGTTWPSDGWRLWLSRRAGRKVRVADLEDPIVLTGGGHPDKRRPRTRTGPVLQPGGHRFVLVPLLFAMPFAQLICYRCSARPRLARSKLVELVEQAVAAGRRDAYA